MDDTLRQIISDLVAVSAERDMLRRELAELREDLDLLRADIERKEVSPNGMALHSTEEQSVHTEASG